MTRVAVAGHAGRADFAPVAQMPGPGEVARCRGHVRAGCLASSAASGIWQRMASQVLAARGRAICAMLRVTMRFDDITGQVASQLRHERAARGKDQERGR